MYFPVAGIEASPLSPFCVAFAISAVCSTSGVSGAFLLLPYQMSVLGYVHPGVSATNQIFNIIACPGGIWRYAREGRFLAPLAWLIAAGTLPGVFLGAILRLRLLNRPKAFLCFAGILLCCLGLRVLWQAASAKAAASVKQGREKPIQLSACGLRGFSFIFAGASYRVKSGPVFLLSLAVGVAGGIYGVGGGAIIAPVLTSFFGLPLYVLGGATLMATFLTSVSGVVFYTFLGGSWQDAQAAPDWRLGILLGLGGLLGMYCGAAAQKYIPARALALFLGVLVASLGLGYIMQFFAS